MTIETYLRELAGLLPSTRRTRVLAEVEAHLREATETRVHEGATRSDAEAGAVEAFGSPHVVAASIWRSTAPIAIRRAAGAALAALASLVLPLYAVPENLLPPAPWVERPAYLGVLLAVALACWVAALALAAVAALVRPRLAAAALALAAVAALGAVGTSLAASVAWHVEVPETPWSILAISGPTATVVVAAVASSAAWARARANRAS